MTELKFGKLRLSAKGTQNGSGFDIFYDFGKSHNFVEFTSKPEFYFIQPWMQFPSNEYTDECMRVSIELVHRFNSYDDLRQEAKWQNDRIKFLESEIERLKAPPNDAGVVVDQQGITFGKNCWVAHEAITGERPGIVKTQYGQWVSSLKIPKDGRVLLTRATGGQK